MSRARNLSENNFDEMISRFRVLNILMYINIAREKVCYVILAMLTKKSLFYVIATVPI